MEGPETAGAGKRHDEGDERGHPGERDEPEACESP